MINAFNVPLYGNYRNRTFNDIYQTYEAFKEDYDDYNTSVINNVISDQALQTTFMLLSANYGNSTVASANEYQFKLKLFSTIFMYGPSWEERLNIQIKIRGLSDEELQQGGKAIYNSALNPNQPVINGVGNETGEGMNTLDELTYINSQNTTNYKKSKAEAYALKWDLLRADVTNEYVTKFKKLFLKVVSPELPLWYVSTDGGDDNE